MIRTISKLLAPLQRRIRLMVGRAVIALVNDTTKEQTVQITLLADEVKAGVERYQEYGFTSVPLSGSEAITVSVGGNRNHSVVIATGDRRYRLKGLAAGEVALYTDEEDKIHLARGNIINIESKGAVNVQAAAAVQVTAPAITLTGAVNIGGNITAVGGTSSPAITLTGNLNITGDIAVEGNITASGSVSSGE